MDRREFIRDGVGLAGIIAAGKAPAAIVKGLVSARESGLVGASKDFDNPYVSDGLVAMWDGIWNVAPSKHDPNTKVWKDLISGYELDFSNVRTCYCLDNAFAVGDTINAGSVKCAVDIEGAFTLESYMSDNQAEYNYYYPSLGYDNICFTWSKDFLQYIITCHEGNVNKLPYGALSLTMTADRTYSGMRVYRNGGRWTSLSLLSFSRPSNGLLTIKATRLNVFPFYYIRLYNRALTEEEIRHNYNIDKERFGL